MQFLNLEVNFRGRIGLTIFAKEYFGIFKHSQGSRVYCFNM